MTILLGASHGVRINTGCLSAPINEATKATPYTQGRHNIPAVAVLHRHKQQPHWACNKAHTTDEL
jgi:hypothetical protein